LTAWIFVKKKKKNEKRKTKNFFVHKVLFLLICYCLYWSAFAYTLCSKKSDTKTQITITMAYLFRIKYPLSGFNYHLSDVNVANFKKIRSTVSGQQLF